MMENDRALAALAIQNTYAIIITDARDRITWVNAAFTNMTGYDPEEVIGKKPGSLLRQRRSDPAVGKLLQKIESRQPFSFESINYTRGERQYWTQIDGQPLFDEERVYHGFFAIARDVSAKVLQEDEDGKHGLSRQRKITLAVLDAQERERAFLWSELQGSLAQHLVVAKFYAEMAKTDRINKETYLDKSSRNINEVIGMIRTICKSLARPNKRLLGLKDSIDNLIDDLMRAYPIDVGLRVEGALEEELTERMQLDLFRIVQEQLNNILKHANATHVDVAIFQQPKMIVLVIADNGQGYDPSKDKGGLGIINIMGRVESQGGRMDILTGPGEGYILRVELPLIAP